VTLIGKGRLSETCIVDELYEIKGKFCFLADVLVVGSAWILTNAFSFGRYIFFGGSVSFSIILHLGKYGTCNAFVHKHCESYLRLKILCAFPMPCSDYFSVPSRNKMEWKPKQLNFPESLSHDYKLITEVLAMCVKELSAFSASPTVWVSYCTASDLSVSLQV
jgi:hypothetical protein